MACEKTRVDLAGYARKGLLEAFKDRQMPCFSVTCQVDITRFKRFVAANGLGFFVPLSYALARAVNAIPELRQRLIDGELYEFARTDPGYTVLLENGTFSFCDSRYFDEFSAYRAHAAERIAAVRACPDHSTGDKSHMFFITDIPWLSFTSFTHPYDARFGSIPLLTIGKYFTQGRKLLIPLAVQVHHGIVDGIHVGVFYERLASMLGDPEGLVGGSHGGLGGR